jgi:hypothetical protein
VALRPIGGFGYCLDRPVMELVVPDRLSVPLAEGCRSGVAKALEMGSPQSQLRQPERGIQVLMA